MKPRVTTIILFLLLATICGAQQSSNLTFTPAQPKPGDKVKIEYSSSGTTIGGLKDITAVAYIYDGQLRAQEVSLSPDGDKWKGEVATNDSTKAISILFRKDDQIDNNKEQGYSLMLYDKGQPVKGAELALAEINNGIGSRLMQLKIDPQQSIELYTESFKKYPDLRTKYLPAYASVLAKQDKTTAAAKIQKDVDAVMAKTDKSEEDYETALNVFRRVGDKENAEKLRTEVLKKFPKGSEAKNDLLNKFYNEPDLVKKQALLAEIIKTYPPATKDEKKQIDQLYANAASSAGAKKDWTLFKKFCGLVDDKKNLIGTYNSLAWNLAGEGLDSAGSSLDIAKEVSGKALAYTKEEMQDLDSRPVYFTRNEWKDNLDFSYGSYADTYALVLWKRGEYEQAYGQQKEAVEKMKMNDGEANERYVIYKVKAKGIDATKTDIENFIKDGKSSPKMTELLKKSFIDAGHSDAEYASYLDGLQKDYRAKLRAEILKRMIHETAPHFVLKDLSGNTVSLDELKGKVVVVDFWATWCGPCKASFPGMQKTLDKYKNDGDVKFVFVDSWENKKPEEMQKNAGDFVAKNKYDFHVLLDTDDKTISSYAVDGIPTKFLIDKESNIRFKEIGYDGNMDKLVDEMSQMIELLKDDKGASDSKKAF